MQGFVTIALVLATTAKGFATEIKESQRWCRFDFEMSDFVSVGKVRSNSTTTANDTSLQLVVETNL